MKNDQKMLEIDSGVFVVCTIPALVALEHGVVFR